MLVLRFIWSALLLSAMTGSIASDSYGQQQVIVDQTTGNLSITSLIRSAPLDYDVDITAFGLEDLNWQDVEGPALKSAPGKLRFILRLDIVNVSHSEQKRFLHFNDSQFENATLWRYEDGQWQYLYQAGRGTSFAMRPIPYHRLIFPLLVSELGESTYLIDIKATDIFKVHLNLLNSASLADKKLREFLLHGLTLGSMLAMILYNLILFTACREKDYLYYSLFTLGTLSTLVIFVGFPHQYLWPDKPSLNNIALYGAVSLIFVTAFLFVLSFFNIRRIHLRSRYNMPFIFLGCFLLIVGAAGSLIWFLIACGIIAIAVCSWGGINGIKMIRQKSFMAGYFTFGWITFSLATLVGLADTFAFLPSNTWVYRFFELSMVATSMLFAFALGAKYAKRKEEQLNLELQLYQEQQEIGNSKLVLESLFHIDSNIPYKVTFNIDREGPLSEEILSGFYLESSQIVLIFWSKFKDEKGANAMLKAALAGVFRTSINCFDWNDNIEDKIKTVHNRLVLILDRSCLGYTSSLSIAAVDVKSHKMAYLCLGIPALTLRSGGQDLKLSANDMLEIVDLKAYSHLKVGRYSLENQNEKSLMDLQIDLGTHEHSKAV